MRRRTLLSSSGGNGRGKIGNYEVVDLGLPSGLLWATCNVGATKEEGYGNYYQWGAGSTTYQNVDQYHTGGTDSSYTLPSDVDTATLALGDGWRMPTQTELQELINNTNYEWVTNFNGSRINGGKFTSKTNPNAYMFFPAVGNYIDGTSSGFGNYCTIWSSTAYDSDRAYDLYVSDGRLISYSRRVIGASVRGVHRKPGKPMPPMSVLFVNKNDTTQKEIFKEEDWPSASDWTPIGIVVVPASHNRYGDGTNGIMSLGCLNTDGTMQTTGTTDNVTMQWGGYGTDTSLSNYTTCDGSNFYGYAQYQTKNSSTALSYASTPNIAYPYVDLTATEHNVISVGSLSDYDGVGNTNILNASASTYIAAAACKKFKTSGTSAGDWYLPAAGELAYLPSIRYQVNDTISALNTKYGNVGVRLNTSNFYWSSSECDNYYVWNVSMSNGYVNLYNYNKTSNLYVRAFLRF